MDGEETWENKEGNMVFKMQIDYAPSFFIDSYYYFEG
jgi:hypothetical protein